MELMQANRQWASRPDDERFTSLTALAAFTSYRKQNSARRVVSNRDITVVPSATDILDIAAEFSYHSGRNGNGPGTFGPVGFSNWAFGQLCGLADAPAGWLKKGNKPGTLIADNLNWGLHHERAVEDVSVMFYRDPGKNLSLAAVNGPNYGVVWDADITATLVQHFGDGLEGQWRVPGFFGKNVVVDKSNTTLYASDRDMWVFLADEDRRIEISDRRDGSPGSLARGFYITNSTVGASYLVLGMFLFDYVCCNRIIWGADQFREIRIRHSSGAPHRWLEEVKPILKRYAEASPKNVVETIAAAKAAKLSSDVKTFLSSRFGKGLAGKIATTFQIEENHPIETVWDAVVGATAYAKALPHIDARVALERSAGEMLSQPVMIEL